MNTQSSQMNKLMYSFDSQMNKLMYSFGKLMYSFQPIDDFKISVLLYSRSKNSKRKIFKMAAFYMILLLIFVILIELSLEILHIVLSAYFVPLVKISAELKHFSECYCA